MDIDEEDPIVAKEQKLGRKAGGSSGRKKPSKETLPVKKFHGHHGSDVLHNRPLRGAMGRAGEP